MVARETSLRTGLRQSGIQVTDEVVRKLSMYIDLLSEEAIPAGFLGPDEGPRLLERHVLESAALASLVSPVSATAGVSAPAPLLDVGSGAGLPGMVVAAVTSSPVTLVEAAARRADFLREALLRTGIAGTVVRARAEEAAHTDLRESATTVVARALAPPPVALELCLPFVALGGRLLIPVGPLEPENEELAAEVAGLLGGGPISREGLEVPGVQERRWVMMVDKVAATPVRFPRRPGVPARRPLG